MTSLTDKGWFPMLRRFYDVLLARLLGPLATVSDLAMDDEWLLAMPACEASGGRRPYSATMP
jgi:hypothetical protein